MNIKQPLLIIVMGVSGCGKSTVAESIAEQYSMRYIDADDFHSADAKATMASGKPLTDEMRAPWIETIATFLKKNSAKQSADVREPLLETSGFVLAYSGLRAEHRQVFRTLGYSTLFVWLHADFDIIAKRLEKRASHFFKPSLLQSQFDALQKPSAQETDVVIVDASVSFPNVIIQSHKFIDNYILTVDK